MRKFLILMGAVVVLFISACTTKPVKLPEGPRNLLFPFGTYQHDVAVRLTKAPPQGPKQFVFQGVIVFQKEKLRMMALSPFGTTLFHIEEDFKTQEIKAEFFIESLKKYEDKIQPFYVVTRDVLTLPITHFEKKDVKVLQTNENGFPIKMEIASSGRTAQVFIKSYDRLNIPQELVVQVPEFELTVKVSDYEI